MSPRGARLSSRAASPITRWSTGSSPSARFDYVYHLAAYAAEGLSHFIKRFNYTNNVIGSANLINAVDQHRRQGLRVHVVDRGLRQQPGRCR